MNGPPPLGRICLNLQTPGTYVLYGTNGAGKTRLLSALQAALWGNSQSEGEAELHFRMDSPRVIESADGDRRLNEIRQALRQPTLLDEESYHFTASTREGQHENPVADVVEGLLRDRDVTHGPQYDARPPEDLLAPEELLELSADRADLDRAIADQGRFIFTARGDNTWRVSIGVVLDDTTPSLREAYGRVRKTIERKLSAGDSPEQLKSLHWPRTWMSDYLEVGGLGRIVDEQRWGVSPPWVALRLIDLADVEAPSAVVPQVITEEDYPYDSILSHQLVDLAEAWEHLELPDEAISGPIDALRFWARQLEGVANEAYARFIDSPPVLEIVLPEFDDWRVPLAGSSARWRAVDRPSFSTVEVGDLSQAQLRWARIAIGISVATWAGTATMEPSIILIDEPEQALHRRAERKLAEGLNWYATEFNGHAICATHSPELLNSTSVQHLHVRRDDFGRTVVDVLRLFEGGDEDARATVLGLPPADLIQLYRTLLLVEGYHDEIVLEECLGEQLAELRVKILRLDGAYELPKALAPSLLMLMTDAHIIAALDNISLDFESTWAAAKHHVERGDVSTGYSQLKRFERSQRHEEQILFRFCVQAIEQSATSRISIFGFTEDDILKYLDPRDFKSDETRSWSEIENDFDGSHLGFKPWLKKNGFKISKATVSRAAERLDSPFPEDFVRLLNMCREAASP